MMTVDDELDVWWDVQACVAMKREEEDNHRCPPDMPPCHDCEARQEEEDERDVGFCW